MATKQDAWRYYFASFANWMMHPGYKRADSARIDLELAAQLADKALEMETLKWPESQQQQ